MNKYVCFFKDGGVAIVEAPDMPTVLKFATKRIPNSLDHISRIYDSIGDTADSIIREFSEKTGWKFKQYIIPALDKF